MYLMFQKVKTPIIVADRCLFQTVYNIDLPNGDFEFLQTSQGNHEITEANACMIGDRVVSFNRFTYSKFEKQEDGRIKILSVTSIDPGKDLPNFI